MDDGIAKQTDDVLLCKSNPAPWAFSMANQFSKVCLTWQKVLLNECLSIFLWCPISGLIAPSSA